MLCKFYDVKLPSNSLWTSELKTKPFSALASTLFQQYPRSAYWSSFSNNTSTREGIVHAITLSSVTNNKYLNESTYISKKTIPLWPRGKRNQKQNWVWRGVIQLTAAGFELVKTKWDTTMKWNDWNRGIARNKNNSTSPKTKVYFALFILAILQLPITTPRSLKLCLHVDLCYISFTATSEKIKDSVYSVFIVQNCLFWILYLLLTKRRTARISAQGLDSMDRAQRSIYKKDLGPIFLKYTVASKFR